MGPTPPPPEQPRSAGTNGTERHPHGSVSAEVASGGVLHIRVDRSEKKNAFTPRMVDGLASALTHLDDDPELFVGVLTFAGDHSTAGLDMPLFFGPDGRLEPPEGSVNPYGMGRRLTKPLITALQGITYTIGIEIALTGDIIVAADDLRMSQLEVRRGLAPLGGGTYRWVQRAGWGNAMYHLLRADELDAAEAYRIGLVQEVVPVGTQAQRALELGAEIARQAPLGVQHTIANARLLEEVGEGAAASAIPAMTAALLASEDFSEGVASFLERRDAVFEGR